MKTEPLMTIFDGPNAELIDRLLSLCFRGNPTILDTTYGNGMFWVNSGRSVTGCDKDPARAKDVCCDFAKLPFADGTFDVVVFDPPFQPLSGSGGGVVNKRFTKIIGGRGAVRPLVDSGLKEAWRVSRRGVIYKCQDYINARKPVWMSLWAYELLGEPYEVVHRRNPAKIKAANWNLPQSAHRNHTTFMVWTRKNERLYRREQSKLAAFLYG
jgi:hypothetical protein